MKRTALPLMGAALLLALLFALAACGDGGSETYYNETGELYIKMNNGTWSMGEAGGEETLSGPYVVGQEGISFRIGAPGGEDMEIFTGQLDGNKLTIFFQGETAATVFYRNGEKGPLPGGEG